MTKTYICGCCNNGCECATHAENMEPATCDEHQVTYAPCAFVPYEFQAVHHIDFDSTNNDPANIRIVDIRENLRGKDGK
jgi:hypothetical protein